MKFWVIAIVGYLITFSGAAQVGNEWINFGQPYFKIQVANDSLYRLTYSTLQNAGVPSGANPRTFQLFHRGVEVAIHVEGEADGKFDTNDYIEFYGMRNDGALDTELYNEPSSQPHKLHNLYSDARAYFLTFGVANGKRIPVISSAGSGPAETYHWSEKLLVLKDQYSGGMDYGNMQATAFDMGEGWMGPQINQNQTGSYTLDGITNAVSAAGAPELEILLTGRGPMNHTVDLHVGPRLLTKVSFTAYQSYRHVQSLLWSDITADGKLTVSATVTGSPDRISVGYIRLRYPQQTDMESAAEKTFTLVPNVNGTAYLAIKNPAPGTRLYDITDPVNVRRVATQLTTTLNAAVAAAGVSRKIRATSATFTPPVKRVTFRSINPAAHNFVIITHALLRKPASGYIDPVKAYAEYRALPQGGQYDTLVVNVDQLYDQFNYGEVSPLAIFHFLKFLASVKTPEYLFLIGKGLDVGEGYHRKPGMFPAYKDLVPTAGYPGSDMAYSSGLSTGTLAPAVATGRLGAMGPQDVAAYLNKVKETEALPYNDLRRKNVLHLSGGISPGEPQQFRLYLEQFGTVASALYLGGKVKAIAKQSTDIEVINVAEEVNSGLNLITFFGHSSSNASDFDIGYATDPVMGYNNKGKYPVLLMNGCSAGSFFRNDKPNFGENWINSSNKGAIGVIAHSSFGFASSLRNYSSLFYHVGYADAQFMNKGLGDIQREVARRYHTMYGETAEALTQTQQMILLGDPAMKLFGAPKPDYEISAQNISISSFDGEPVTALSGAFRLNFVVSNFGSVKNQDFSVSVSRALANGSTIVYDSLFSPVFYNDTLSFTIPGNAEGGFGNNTFTITIDADQAVDELREDNNAASATFFIPINGTKNLYPANYAIVNRRAVSLSLQHTDMRSGEREFLLEVDTTDTFNSPFRQQYTVRGTVLASQQINLLPNDTLAYYWRTKLADELPNESKQWDVNSFTYIADGAEGWAQVHFPQYAGNPSEQLVKDAVLRRLQFEETSSDIAIETFSAASGKQADAVSFRINGAEYNLHTEGVGDFSCRNNTINLVAFDKKTTQAYPGIFLTWIDIRDRFGGRRLICGREPYVINSFTPAELSAGNNADLITYVDNIPAGDSVVLFNIGNAGYELWPLAAKNKLGELGIAVEQLNELQAGEPVVILARKGTAPGAAKVYRDVNSAASEKRVKLSGTVTGRLSAGTLRTTRIGPSQHWDKFMVRYTEAGTSDEVLFNITGVRLDGNEVLLMADVTGSSDLSGISATDYPYLKIDLKIKDNILLTAVQLDKWLVTYTPVAEGLLLYRGPAEKQVLFEGQQWDGSYSFVNISNQLFHDSLTVDYHVVNPETFVSRRQQMKIQAPAPGDTTQFVVPFGTAGQPGLNDAEVFVNPRVMAEQSYDNNFIVLSKHLDIITDTRDPVLDVTFDGRHIFKDEFVSPSPAIGIRLHDDNPFMLKKDTTGVSLLLSDACQADECGLKPVYFSRQDVRWQAESDTSDFVVSFNPVGLPDGTYVLRVEARDVKGNASGAEPYEISFQVKGETAVSILPPYPNPFHYKANFSFTVSGEVMPSAFGLQILTVTGEVVHDFSAADTSAFHIGTNTIGWPALDPSGNPLPNGVYIFSMMLRVNGQEVVSKGKIVLVR